MTAAEPAAGTVYRCNRRRHGCEAELFVPASTLKDAAKLAARTAGWRVLTPRLRGGQPLAPVFTCGDCVAAE